MRVLLIEDSQLVAGNVTDFFESAGHSVDVAGDGMTGLRLACSTQYSALIVDVQLPVMDGLRLCARFRTERGRGTPVLILTARDTLEDKLEGFKAGADDYLVKPFEIRELLARVEALHRRAMRDMGSVEVLRFGDVEFDLGAWRVEVSGGEVELNRTGLRVLELLLRAAPCLVKRERILDELWGDDHPEPGVLRTHVYALRRALAAADSTTSIATVRGVGYQLEVAGEG